MYKLLRINWNQLEIAHNGLFNTVASLSSDSSSTTSVKIPRRKERGPTDILQTLSSTIGRDPTAPHYKYHDDPFLIPMSNIGKRTFAMAQEAGRKAAKWIVNEHAELFNHKLADPPIQVFAPNVVYNENSNVEEETLAKVIETGNVGDALIIYELLSTKKKEISDQTKQSLLELVCFTNAADGIPEELIEERWFASTKPTKKAETLIKTWKDNGVADTLFKSLSTSSTAAYSAIIQGMAKYGQIQRAWEHYEASREKGLVLDVGAYNALLSISNNLKQGSELRWQLLQVCKAAELKDLLARMAAEKIQPNIYTLNAVLLSLSVMGGNGVAQNALACLAEFRGLGIEPSLGSFYLLLQIVGRDRATTGSQWKAMSDILDRLENTRHEIRHPLDIKFFGKAMEVCRFSAVDPDLARRVDALLHVGDNYNLIGDSYEESVYYRNFFILLCNTESLDHVMETYNLLVPNVYTPEPSVIQELLKTVDTSGNMELFPRLWSDIVWFDLSDREPVLTQILDALVRNEPQQDSPLVDTFADIARQVWDKIENQPANRINVISWSGELLSNVMILSSRSKNLEMASLVMKKLSKEQSYLGDPSIEALCAYMDLCIAENDVTKALDCLQYCKDTSRAEVVTMAKDLRSRLTLTDDHAQILAKILADP